MEQYNKYGLPSLEILCRMYKGQLVAVIDTTDNKKISLRWVGGVWEVTNYSTGKNLKYLESIDEVMAYLDKATGRKRDTDTVTVNGMDLEKKAEEVLKRQEKIRKGGK